MVAPQNVVHNELVDGVRTWMTLMISETANISQITQGFQDLSDTLFRFLTNLKSITASMSDPFSDKQTKTMSSYPYHERSGRASLTKVSFSEPLLKKQSVSSTSSRDNY